MDVKEKYMVELYIKIYRELDTLMGDYMRSNTELRLLKECEEPLVEKLNNATDEINRQAWEGIINGVFYKELEEASKRERDSFKAVGSPIVKQKIAYLELKLDMVKKNLDTETLKTIATLEIKNFF